MRWVLLMDGTWYCVYFHFVSLQKISCLFCLPMAEEVKNPVKLLELLKLLELGAQNSNVWREKYGTFLKRCHETLPSLCVCVCVYVVCT